MRSPYFLSLVAVALLAACDSGTTAPGTEVSLAKSDNAPVHRASGGGTVFGDFAGEAQVAFNATVDGAGNAKGEFELHRRVADQNVHGDVVCLNVVGNTATVQGIVTRVDNPNLFIFEGRYIAFRVIDNGEGANDPPDLVSHLFVFVGPGTPSCVPIAFPFVNDWTNGNVQVR